LLRWLHDDRSVRERLALDSFAMVGFNYLGSFEAAMPALGDRATGGNSEKVRLN
jgi:hypothetical protein